MLKESFITKLYLSLKLFPKGKSIYVPSVMPIATTIAAKINPTTENTVATAAVLLKNLKAR